MQVAVASGKGGTGKTTVAVGLALCAPEGTQLLDCDVEEPNVHLFLQPTIETRETVGIPIPEVDAEACTACGKCGEICEFNAIIALKTQPLVFPQLCHGCGGCQRICPEHAIHEVDHPIGEVLAGGRDGLRLHQGTLRVGAAMAPPLIRAVKARARAAAVDPDGLTIIDAPPGTSCPVIEAVRESDFVLLVTEPTPFGLNDLRLAVEMVRRLERPHAVLINRAGLGDDSVQEYCRAEGLEILLEIPDDRRIAEVYSRAEPLVSALPEYRETFTRLLAEITRRAQAGVGGSHG